jgi:hypothetical protein
MTPNVVFQSLSIVIALLALCISIWGDWLRDHFGWRGRTKLHLYLDEDNAPALYHPGWIEQIDKLSPALKPTDRLLRSDSRVKVHFYRARVHNSGRIAAKSVTLTLEKLEYRDSIVGKKALENPVRFRWSDVWSFHGDADTQIITASATDGNWAVLAEHTSKYCDFCFYYDRNGPRELGGLRRDKVYFAVLKVPSEGYSMMEGCYRAHLHLSAENAKSVYLIVDIDLSWARIEPLKIMPRSTVQG